jgi:hypothetical protein
MPDHQAPKGPDFKKHSGHAAGFLKETTTRLVQFPVSTILKP